MMEKIEAIPLSATLLPTTSAVSGTVPLQSKQRFSYGVKSIVIFSVLGLLCVYSLTDCTNGNTIESSLIVRREKGGGEDDASSVTSSEILEDPQHHRRLSYSDPASVVMKTELKRTKQPEEDGTTVAGSAQETTKSTHTAVKTSTKKTKTGMVQENAGEDQEPNFTNLAKSIIHEAQLFDEFSTPDIVNDAEHVEKRKEDLPWHHNMTVPYGLPHSAFEWCLPPHHPKLEYEKCNGTDLVNVLPLYGGLTNALKMVLLGAILSFEENRCFFVDESNSHLHKRKDTSQQVNSFINHYFAPIGLSINSGFIKSARESGEIRFREWQEVWNERNRRPANFLYNISSLGYYNMEGHRLKRIMMRRLWRPQPQVRNKACKGLANHGLKDEFIAMSIRRGDKGTEKFVFAKTEQYIEEADKVIATVFHNKAPMIFVATDDCRAVDELRQLRPAWTFVSECDNESNIPGQEGFDLNDVASWSPEQTDAHYFKFFVELYAMAVSKVFIGVWYTNVTWWAYFMRQPNDSTFRVIRTEGTQGMELPWF